MRRRALLATALARLTNKPKPLSYLETHAGRGLYDIGSAAARRTGERARRTRGEVPGAPSSGSSVVSPP